MDLDAWSKRAAKKQVDELSLQKAMSEKARKESSGRNIWTGKAMRGPQGDGGPPGRRARELSLYRCVPEVDCGRTKGSDAKQRTFCLYFAKGCCAHGSSCIYLHRVPTADDEEYHSKDMGADIFGREKRAEHEGYRKGAGTFERDNRTLYVNYEGAGSYELPKIRELIQNNFSVWGPIKSIYIAHRKTLAFVRYEWRSSAEFAKEAMHKQKLLGSTQAEILTCRWSNEDPNPVAVVQKKRDYADAFETAALASWDALPEEQQQARIMQLQLAASLRYRQRVISDYPDTDAQYGAEAGGYPDTDAQYGGEAEQQGQGCTAYDSRLGDPVLALCGGGEAALHPPSAAITLYPASGDTCSYLNGAEYQYGGQAGGPDQLHRHHMYPPHIAYSSSQGPGHSCAGLFGTAKGYDYSTHCYYGDCYGGSYGEAHEANAAAGEQGGGFEQAHVPDKGGDKEEQGQGEGAEGLMGLLAGYGSDEEDKAGD